MNKEQELSKEIQGVLKNNPIPMLRKIGLLDPEAMRQQVCHRSRKENSFYISMIKAYESPEIRSEILQFCLDYGYDPKEEITILESTNQYNFVKLTKDSVGNDYLLAWGILGDINLEELSRYCGKIFIQETEKKGNFLLESAYLRFFSQTIKVLDEFDINDENHSGKNDILALAEKSKQTLDIYWELKKNKNPNLDSYGSVKNYLSSLIQNNNSKNGYGSKYQTNNIKEYLSSELLKQTPENQEELISMTVMCAGVQPFNHALKLKKTNIKEYKPKKFPIWLNLGDATSQDFLYSFIKEKTPVDSYDKETDIYYLEAMSEYLSSIYYVDGGRNSSSGAERAKKEKILNELQSIKTYSFLLQENPNSKNKEPWFNTLCKEQNFVKVFYKTWLNVSLEKLKKEDNILTLKEMLDRTWFYKDETGNYSFEHAIKNNSSILNEDLAFFANYFEKDEYNTLISFDAKLKLFKTFVNHVWSIENFTEFSKVFESIATNTEMIWKNFSLEEDLENKLKRNAPEILIKIKHYKLEESLLENDKVKTAKVKI